MEPAYGESFPNGTTSRSLQRGDNKVPSPYQNYFHIHKLPNNPAGTKIDPPQVDNAPYGRPYISFQSGDQSTLQYHTYRVVT